MESKTTMILAQTGTTGITCETVPRKLENERVLTSVHLISSLFHFAMLTILNINVLTSTHPLILNGPKQYQRNQNWQGLARYTHIDYNLRRAYDYAEFGRGCIFNSA